MANNAIPETNDPGPPIRLVTRFLAEMQSTIVAAGIRAFDGDLDRFVIYTLIVRQGEAGLDPHSGAISAHSLAASLSRPFETVRRHVIALVDAALCHRTPQGVIADTDARNRPEIRDLRIVAHDALVRMVEDLGRFGVALPAGREGAVYDPAAGLQASADMMLAVLDANRSAHREWLNLVVFSTILCANSRGYVYDPVRALRYRDEHETAPDAIRRPVRAATVARALGIPETTLRRHVTELMRRGVVQRVRTGLLVNEGWMNTPPAVAISTASFHNIRRILGWLEARGFPFAAPETAYIHGRPEPIAFA